MRRRLIRRLRDRGIRSERVLQAMNNVPRHFFLETAFLKWAYEDVAFPIDSDQTISQPYTVAYQTELLGVEAGDRVLEIGTGSGYQATVLAELGAEVYTIERHEQLYHKTKALLQRINYPQIHTIYGDGYRGLPDRQPFAGILVTAGAERVPDTLLDQLAVGGRLVIPVGKKRQQMRTYERLDNTRWQKQTHGAFRFVPFLPGVQPQEPPSDE